MKFKDAGIAKLLVDKGATKPCHRCGGIKFAVIDGFSNFYLQDEIKGVILGGPTVPVVSVICNNCGAITSHAAGALGLLNQKEHEEKKND